MAKHSYNTFVVSECKTNRVLLVTSSARKARNEFRTGRRIEVWSCNRKVKRVTVRCKERHPLQLYLDAEREFIGMKQHRAEERNKRRAGRPNGKTIQKN